MKLEKKQKRFLIVGIVLVVAVLLGAAALYGFGVLKKAQVEADSALAEMEASDKATEKVTITDDELSQLISGDITLDSLVQEAGEVEFEPDETDDGEPALPEETAGSKQAASSQQSAAASKPAQKPTAESKPQETQPAASGAEKPKPAEPAGYEAELKGLIQQVYAVKARGESGLNASIAAAKSEYKALPENQQTQTRKLIIVFSKAAELNALQSSCDKEMNNIVSQMRTILQENGQSTALADQVMDAYKAEKSARYTELLNKLYS